MFSALALNGLDARALVDELRLRMREELDYRREAANIAEFAQRFAGHPWVRIPAAGTRATRPARVLTTEWVDGMAWDEFVATASGPTKQRAAEVIWRFAQHSVHRLGVFNGDPHPGNYRFHHDGSVTFLDFGLVKRWAPGEWERLGPTLDAIVVSRDPDRLATAMEQAGFLVADHGLDPAARLRLRVAALPAVPPRRVHVHQGVDAQHARTGSSTSPDRTATSSPSSTCRPASSSSTVWCGASARSSASSRRHGPWRAMLLEYRTGAAPATELGAAELAWRG